MTTETSAGRQAPPLWQLWVRWGYSPGDHLVHAFQVDDSQLGRAMQALCEHTVRPCWIPPGGAQRCPMCVLGVRAPSTERRHRRTHLGWWTRLVARCRARWVLGRR